MHHFLREISAVRFGVEKQMYTAHGFLCESCACVGGVISFYIYMSVEQSLSYHIVCIFFDSRIVEANTAVSAKHLSLAPEVALLYFLVYLPCTIDTALLFGWTCLVAD